MESNTFKVLRDQNWKDLKIQLAIQCAPVLAGIKIANLLNIRGQDVPALVAILCETSIDVFQLYLREDKAVLLLYRREELEEYLSGEKVLSLLQRQGYRIQVMNGMLQELKERYTSYRLYGGGFPHEMGLFLGYPEEDVKGFIEKKGQDFLYCGYWKVYSNPSVTKEVFDRYNRVSDFAVRLVVEDQNILALVDMLHDTRAGRRNSDKSSYSID